jgi:hypothetical protein
LVTVITGYPVSTKKFTGKSRVQRKGGREELRKMRILCRGGTQQQTQTAEQDLFLHVHHDIPNVSESDDVVKYIIKYYGCLNYLRRCSYP